MKTCIIITFALLLLSLITLVLSGREYKKRKSKRMLKLHRQCVWISYFVSLVSICFVETYVRAKEGVEWDTVMFFHLFFAIGYIILLIIATIYNGLKKPVIHRKIVYSVFVFYVVALISGIFLLYR